MSEYICENCGHMNEFLPASHLDIKEVFDWKASLGTGTATALSANRFKKVKGEWESDAGTIKFTTLFLSAVKRRPLIDVLMDPENPPSLQKDIEEVYRDKIAPVLETINSNFRIIGNLSLPSAIKLAVTDLSQPVSVFCFVTIEEPDNLQTKLAQLGLTRLTAEGCIPTVGDDWDFFNQP